jgi:hypothetical protein
VFLLQSLEPIPEILHVVILSSLVSYRLPQNFEVNGGSTFRKDPFNYLPWKVIQTCHNSEDLPSALPINVEGGM